MAARGKEQIRWTDEMKAQVQRLYCKEGKTNAEVARAIGCGATRSAVAGLIGRLGWKRDGALRRSRHSNPRSFYAGQSRSIKQFFMYGVGFVPNQGKAAPGLRDTKIAADDPSPDEWVKLIDLKSHHCRFPFGEPSDMAYCGRDVQPSSSYCEQHHKRCRFKARVW
jgi:hypothetical protein